MGTRGLIEIRHKGKVYRLYNHFDSYPSALGVVLCEELIELLQNKDAFLKAIEQMQWIEEDSDRKPTQKEIEHLQPWTNITVATRSKADWYCLLRETQGSLKESLCCGFAINTAPNNWMQYTYLIDLEKNTFGCKDDNELWSVPLQPHHLQRLLSTIVKEQSDE